jgi:hypothetical protein
VARRVARVAAASAAYLLISLGLLAHVIAAGPAHASSFLEYDSAGYVYVNAWVAHAIAHLQNPLWIPNLNHPVGLNVLASPFDAGLAIVFAPVTWLFGPVAALNAQLALVPVAGALAMATALHDWVRRYWIAAVVGAAWAFSPEAVGALARGWTNVGTLVLGPVVLWVAGDLLVFRRHSPRRLGLVLASGLVAQFLVSSEMLTITLIGAAVALAVAALAGWRLRGRAEAARRVGACLAWAAPITLVVLAGGLLYELAGPDRLWHWVRPRAFFAAQGFSWFSALFDPHGPALVREPGLSALRVANPAYLGVGAIAVVALGLYVRRRDVLAWSMAVLVPFGLWVGHGRGELLSPLGVILRLPVLHNLTITRFCVVAFFGALVLTALTADRLADLAAARAGRRGAAGAALAVLALALVAPALAVAATVPYDATTSHGDPALATVLSSPGRHRVLTYPAPLVVRGMIQQARSGDFDYDLSGGYGPNVADGAGRYRLAERMLVGADYNLQALAPTRSELGNLAALLRRWATTDAIVPLRDPDAEGVGYSEPFETTELLTEVLGPPRLVDGEWVWRHVHAAVPARVLDDQQWAACGWVLTARAVRHLPTCVVRALAH